MCVEEACKLFVSHLCACRTEEKVYPVELVYKMIMISGGSRISRRGGVDLIRGAMDPRGGYVSKVLHVKAKESGPVGGGGARRARPP